MEKREPKATNVVPEHELRQDSKTALFVELAIAIQFASGTPQAAEYLQKKGVDVKLAIRTLMQPYARRVHHEWKYPR